LTEFAVFEELECSRAFSWHFTFAGVLYCMLVVLFGPNYIRIRKLQQSNPQGLEVVDEKYKMLLAVSAIRIFQMAVSVASWTGAADVQRALYAIFVCTSQVLFFQLFSKIFFVWKYVFLHPLGQNMDMNVSRHLLAFNCLVGLVVVAGFVCLFVLQPPTRSKVRQIFSVTFAVFSVCLSLGFLIFGYLVSRGVQKAAEATSKLRSTANHKQKTSKQQRFTLRLAVSFSVLYAAQAVTWVVVPEDLETADTSTWSFVYHFLNVAGLIIIHRVYGPKIGALENKIKSKRNLGYSGISKPKRLRFHRNVTNSIEMT